MAYVKCEEIGHGVRAYVLPPDYNIALDVPEEEIERSWRLTGNDATDTLRDLVTSAQGVGDLPAQWEADPDNPNLLASNFQVRETEFPEVHVVAVRYKLVVPPQDEPAVWRFSTGQQEVAIDEDIDGFAMLNSAGDPFDPPPTRPEPYLIMTCTKNLLNVNENDIITNYLHHVNSLPYRGIAPGQVYMADFSANQKYRAGTHYYETQWTFWARERSWQLRILDCGFRHWPGPPLVATTRLLIRGPDGAPVSSPASLDGAGRKLAPGAQPQWLDFKICDEVDFNLLNLGGR